MTRLSVKTRLALTVAVAAAPLAPAAARTAPERFELGSNAEGYTCSAARQWTVGEGVRRASDQPFGITCRGLSAAEAQGYLSAPGAAVDAGQCGEAVTRTLPGIGPAEVRRCFDAKLARPAVDIRFTRRGVTYQGAALETTVGPLEAALRTVAAGDAPPSGRSEAKASVDLASLPAGPAASTATQGSGITAEAALTDGIAALQAGRMLDAQRILNDGIRAFVSADPATRVDLRLAAALADSGLSQFESATGHIGIAKLLLANNPEIDDIDYKQQQLATYQGIHLINQRRWNEAIDALSAGAGSTSLMDPLTVSRLNQEATIRQDTLQSSLADTKSFARDLLDAQRFWALSVAYLALGRVDEADAALARAALAARDPVRAAPPERITWMRATIERQKGRIEAQRGRFPAALASFDCAIAALKGDSVPGGQCLMTGGGRLPDAALNAPLLVEAQLERASIASRDAANAPADVLAQYGAAVSSLPNLAGTGYVSLAALERYFGLLAAAPADAARDEEFFRAMQAIGEPAIAREYAQLQKVVSANADVSDLLRQRGDLERQLIRLRYDIAAAGAAGSDLARLEQERGAADARLAEVNAKLLAANGIGALEDQAATVASIRETLAPGEVYLKLTAMRSSMFGIAIGRDRTVIYQVADRLPQIERLAATVLTSARSDENKSIRPFDVAGSNRLFQAVAGPAADMLRAADRIIYNPAGPLRQVPASILVTDPASVAAYAAQPAKGDYSKVAFLGARSEVTTALSPRAFLYSRKEVTPSTAPRPFLSLGPNAQPQLVSNAMAERPMPFDCEVTWAAWANTMGSRPPVRSDEVGLAVEALGLSSAPGITGAAFTDSALLANPANGELAQYQILHFATHGVPQQAIEVDQCRMNTPPSLVTTLAPPTQAGQVLSDGLLSFDEVARLRLNANLVVLSACETAADATAQSVISRGGLESTSALDGLVRSFIVANARSVLATFWAVPDIVQSDQLMATFYRTGRAAPISAALKTAQTAIIVQPRYSHPYYWAAYFLVGDGAKPMLTGAVQTASR